MKYLKNLIVTILLSLSVLVALTIASTALSRVSHAFEPIELKEVYINYHWITPNGRDPLFTSWGLKPQKDLEVHINFDTFKYIYWDNNIHSTTDEHQFKLVGWEARIGIHILDCVDLGIYHHSQHILDGVYPYDGFPVKDAIELRLNIYKSKNLKRGGIL